MNSLNKETYMHVNLLKYRVNITLETVDHNHPVEFIQETPWDYTLYFLALKIDISRKVELRPRNWAKEIYHDYKTGEETT